MEDDRIERQDKMEQDFTVTVDAQLPIATELAKVSYFSSLILFYVILFFEFEFNISKGNLLKLLNNFKY